MVKNIVIGVLVVFSLGCLTFAFYQKTVAENARIEAVNQLQKAMECAESSRTAQEEARKAEEMAHIAMLEAMEQRQIAETPLADATQKLRAEKANK